MRIVNAYFGNGAFSNVKLSIDIERCAPNMVTDINKLDALLNKQKSKFPETVAVCDWSEGQLTLFESNKFTGILWANRHRLTGIWETF